MTMTIGMGNFVYEYQADRAELPDGTTFQRPSGPISSPPWAST